MAANVFELPFEVGIIEWLQTYLPGWLVEALSFMSIIGETLPLIAILGFLYWSYRKEFGKRIGDTMITANVLFPLIKNVAIRKRPYMVHPDTVECLKPVEKGADLMDISAQGYSFPSGHSLNAVVVYGSLAYHKKSKILTVLAVVLPILVGVSRFTIGVHYPSDVLAGWLLGTLLIFLVPWLIRKLKREWVYLLIVAVAGAAGFFYCRTSDFYTSYGLLIGYFLGVLYEEHFVKFSDTTRILSKILRLVGGIGIYLGFNELLKLPFPKDFLNSATTGAFIVRTARYAIVSFLMIGVYPLLFDRIPFLHDKKQEDESASMA